ncbi:MAG: PH domain-containing protein [Candidatus Nanogingivalaceae bacterium]|jgi:hypothetical protein cdiviTM7_03058|nr:PH domain-containing protein [Candidatus Nanogingivalaceae bacterium]
MSAEFEGLHNGEKVLLVFRRHIIAMRKGFYSLLIPMTIGALPFLIWQTNLDLLWIFVGGFVLGLILFIYHFLMWFYTVYVVTNERIRQITQRGFFGRDVVEISLDKVQSISYNIPGFSGEVFKFGTIIMRTYVGDMVIRLVEHPSEIYNKLQDAVHEAESKKRKAYEEYKIKT